MLSILPNNICYPINDKTIRITPFTSRYCKSEELVLNNIMLPFENLRKMGIKNLRTSGDNIITGATLEKLSVEDLAQLKKQGIDFVIDYRADGGSTLLQKCKKSALKYFNFPLDDLLELKDGKYFVKPENEKMRVTNYFVALLKKYFDIINNKKVYAGCQYGIDRTNLGLSLDYLLNKDVNHTPFKIFTWPGDRKKTVVNRNTKIVKKILKSLSDEQKKYLGLSVKNNDFTNSQIKNLVQRNSNKFNEIV